MTDAELLSLRLNPPVAETDKSQRCEQTVPQGTHDFYQWVCTRTINHSGPHVGHYNALTHARCAWNDTDTTIVALTPMED